MAKKKNRKRKGIIRRAWERIIRTQKGSGTEAGKVDLKTIEWPMKK